MSEIRFSLAERTPGAIKSPGGISGKTIAIEDEANVRRILDVIHKTKVEDHSRNPDWILLCYKPNDTKTLRMAGHGQGGLNEFRSQAFDNQNVYYGLIRVIDENQGVKTTRFVYITFIGEKVGGITNARIGVNKAAVTSLIGHYSIETTVSSISELSDENIIGRVGNASGSQSNVTEKCCNFNNRGNARPPANSTSSFVPKTGSSSDGVSIADELGAKSYVQDIRKGCLNWMALSYLNAGTLNVIGKGNGGLGELKSHLKSDQVIYAFLSVNYRVDATEMKRFIYIRWVPADVPAMFRGKITPHRGFVEDWFSPSHLIINASEQGELTEETISEKLKQLK